MLVFCVVLAVALLHNFQVPTNACYFISLVFAYAKHLALSCMEGRGKTLINNLIGIQWQLLENSNLELIFTEASSLRECRQSAVEFVT